MPSLIIREFNFAYQSKVVLLKKVNKQPVPFQVTWLFTIPYSFPEKLIQPSGSIVYAAVRCCGENSKQKRAFFFLIFIIYKFEKGAPLAPKLQASAQRLFSRCCFFFSYFILLSTQGRLRADRCLPGEIGASEVCPSGGFLYYLSIPSSARTVSENLRLRSLFATQ